MSPKLSAKAFPTQRYSTICHPVYNQYLCLLHIEHCVMTDLAAVPWPMSAILKSRAYRSKVCVMLAVVNDDAHGHRLLLWVLWCPYSLRVSPGLPKAMNQFCSETARCDDFTMLMTEGSPACDMAVHPRHTHVCCCCFLPELLYHACWQQLAMS